MLKRTASKDTMFGHLFRTLHDKVRATPTPSRSYISLPLEPPEGWRNIQHVPRTAPRRPPLPAWDDELMRLMLQFPEPPTHVVLPKPKPTLRKKVAFVATRLSAVLEGLPKIPPRRHGASLPWLKDEASAALKTSPDWPPWVY